MKLSRKSVVALFLVVTIFLSLNTITFAYLNKGFDIKMATNTLEQFLDAIVKDDASAAFEVLEDKRYELNPNVRIEDLSDEEMVQIKKVATGEKFRQLVSQDPLAKYSIIDSKLSIDGDSVVIQTLLIFENAREAKVPFVVSLINGAYKIVITPSSLADNGYEIVKEKEIPDESFGINASNRLDGYKFWHLFGTIYGIDSFNISKPTINIIGSQYNDMYPNWTLPAEIVYAIVRQRWYGDDEWGSTGNAIVKNGSINIYIYGKNSSFSNARIRIANQTGAHPRSRGEGSVYEID